MTTMTTRTDRSVDYDETLSSRTKAFQDLPWPDEVPVLVAADVATEDTPVRSDKHPLWIWLRLAFPLPTEEELAAYDAERQACEEAGNEPRPDPRLMTWAKDVAHHYLLKVLDERAGHWGSLFTHSEQMTPAELADAWNECLGRLGYAAPKSRWKPAKEP